MKQPPVYFRRWAPFAVLLLGAVPLSAQTTARKMKVDCAGILQKMRTDFAADPGSLVLAMEDALTSNEACACPIVRTAVDLSGKEPRLIKEILIAAIHLLPNAAAEITECVLLEAPEAAATIRATLAKELGEKTPELLAPEQGKAPVTVDSGNDGGKSPVGKAPLGKESIPAPPPDFDYPDVGVNGIYFSARAVATIPGNTALPEDFRSVTRKKHRPRRPVSPVTETSPG